MVMMSLTIEYILILGIRNNYQVFFLQLIVEYYLALLHKLNKGQLAFFSISNKWAFVITAWFIIMYWKFRNFLGCICICFGNNKMMYLQAMLCWVLWPIVLEFSICNQHVIAKNLAL